MNKYDILSKPYWSINDIVSYFEISSRKAYEIRRVALSKYGGYSPLVPSKTRRDSIFRVLNIDIQLELKLAKNEKGE